MTLEEYFREDLNRDVIEHIVRVSRKDGKIEFYIHPSGINGKTIDFIVNGNNLETKFVSQ